MVNFDDFLHPELSASRVKHVSDLHLKFADQKTDNTTSSPYWLVVVDLALSAQYLCCQFFYQYFQSIETSIFGGKQLKQSLCFIFLIFW